jgi:hypothetical protein
VVTVPVDVSVWVEVTVGIVVEVSVNVFVGAVLLAIDQTLLNGYELTLDSRICGSGYSSLYRTGGYSRRNCCRRRHRCAGLAWYWVFRSAILLGWTIAFEDIRDLRIYTGLA